MRQRFLDLIDAEQSFLLTGHEHPDGDCAGAQVAMYHLLRGLDKDVRIVNPDPVSRNHRFLSRHTPFASYRGDGALAETDVVVLLDCAHLSRLGALGRPVAESRATIAVVDHHVGSEDGDGVVSFVDVEAPSTGALVHGLFESLGVPLTEPAAEGVFLSLVSDTGWFRFSNTDARVLSLAADLVRAGIDPSAFYDRVNRRNHPDSVRFLARSLGNHRYELGGRYAHAYLGKADAEAAGRLAFDTDAILELLRSVEGVEVVALFKERQDGSVKISLRAKRDFDVYRVAAELGGGGHRKAAGAMVRGPLEQARARVLEMLRVALDASKDAG